MIQILQKWAPHAKVHVYYGTSSASKARALRGLLVRGGVCITSYGLIASQPKAFGSAGVRGMIEATGRTGSHLHTFDCAIHPTAGWDYIVLDEGHKIKNPSTKVAKAFKTLPACNRVILTGTPIQVCVIHGHACSKPGLRCYRC